MGFKQISRDTNQLKKEPVDLTGTNDPYQQIKIPDLKKPVLRMLERNELPSSESTFERNDLSVR